MPMRSSINPTKIRKRIYSSSSSSSRSPSPAQTPARRLVAVSSTEDDSEDEPQSPPRLSPPASVWGLDEGSDLSAISGPRRSEASTGAGSEWDWGSVAGTDEEDEIGDEREKRQGDKDGLGNAEPALDAEEGGATRARGVGVSLDDWGTVGAGRTVRNDEVDEDNENGEELEDIQHAQMLVANQAPANDDWGVEMATDDEEGLAEEEETGEDVPAQATIIDEEAREAESSDDGDGVRLTPIPRSPSTPEEEDDNPTTPTSRRNPRSATSRSRSSQTPEISSPSPTPSPPPPSSKSRFIQHVSQQFRESLNTGSTPRVKGRRRGAQVNKFLTEYLDLLNAEIRAARDRSIYGASDNSRLREGSYVLGSYWTCAEKEVFFNNLAVLGKDAVDGISKAVGTKSTLECRAYVQLLQEGLLGTYETVGYRSRDTVGLKDIPAVVELSDDCVAALERQADFIEGRNRRDGERIEKRRWGECWLIDEELAADVEGLYRVDDTEGIHEIAPEAELLNVAKMLELSEKYFMNGHGESNYRTLVPLGETPSIRRTALQDIHSLVLSITRRLVQTSMFMAESRLRNMESQIFAPIPSIRLDDVQAAAEAMNLPQNMEKFWAQLPRRTGLGVVQHLIQMKYKVPKTMELKNVEEYLNKPINVAYGTGTKRKPNPRSEAGDSSAEEVDITAPSQFSSSDSDSPDHPEPIFISTHTSAAHIRRTEKLTLLAAAEDRYLSTIDARQSLREEKELWRMMGFSSNSPEEEEEEEEEEAEEEQKPPRRRGARHLDLTDWRDEVVYRAPWEWGRLRMMTWPEAEHTHQAAPPHQPPNRIRKRVAEETDAGSDDDVEVPPAKRSKSQSQSKPKSKPKPALLPVQRSPSRARNRRQRSAPVGFVSTVDARFDSDDGGREGGGEGPYMDEDEDEEEYREG